MEEGLAAGVVLLMAGVPVALTLGTGLWIVFSGQFTTPEGAAGEPLSFNVHALGGRFVSLQRAALAALRPPWIRVTLGLVTDVDAARAYAGAGPALLGLVADHRLGPIDAAGWPDLVEAIHDVDVGKIELAVGHALPRPCEVNGPNNSSGLILVLNDQGADEFFRQMADHIFDKVSHE